MLEAMALDKVLILSYVHGLREPFNENLLGNTELFRICQFEYLERTNNTNSYISAVNHFATHPDDKEKPNSNRYILGKDYYQRAIVDISHRVTAPEFFWFLDDIEW